MSTTLHQAVQCEIVGLTLPEYVYEQINPRMDVLLLLQVS